MAYRGSKGWLARWCWCWCCCRSVTGPGLESVFSAYGRGGGIVRVEGAGEVVWLSPLGFVVFGVGFHRWERGRIRSLTRDVR